MQETPLVSVLTATHDPEAPFLHDAYTGIIDACDDVEWEWVLQFDGDIWPEVPEWINTDKRIKLECNGACRGAAITRNRALNRVAGEYVQALDADDYLLPGATAEMLAVLRSDPVIRYVIGRTRHLAGDELLTDDGHRRSQEVAPLPYGKMMPGVLFDHWRSQGNYLPLNPNCTLWTRDLLFSQRGWAGLAVAEDLPLLLAASEISTGYYLDKFVSVYRQHDESIMHQEDILYEERPRFVHFTEESILAARRLRPLGDQA